MVSRAKANGLPRTDRSQSHVSPPSVLLQLGKFLFAQAVSFEDLYDGLHRPVVVLVRIGHVKRLLGPGLLDFVVDRFELQIARHGFLSAEPLQGVLKERLDTWPIVEADELCWSSEC